MANTKLTALTELTSIASGDYLYVVDVSDTTDGSDGTSKKITRTNAVSGLAASGANTDITSLGGLTTPLSVAQGGTGVATITSGEIVVGNGTSAVTSLGTTGTGNVVRATSPTLVTPVLGTPTSGTLTNCTGLPISTGVSGLGTGVATFLATPTSANLAAAVTNETGSGALVFGTSPTLTTPVISSISNTGTLTLPTSTDTLVGRATTDTLTNKTLTKPTLSGSVTTYTVDTDGATVTFDLSASNWHSVILGGNRTLALSNQSVNQVFMLDLIQDGTGSRTVTWFASNSATATVTIAAPGVLTTGVDIPTLTPVVLTTTGALPTGLTAGTTYYYVRQSSTTGNLATSVANAQAGTVITTTGSQSGTHTCAVQIRWQNQVAPTLSTGKYIKDSFGFRVISTGVIDGTVIGQGF